MEKKIHKILYSVHPGRDGNFLRFKKYGLERDVHKLSSILFNIETVVKAHRNHKLKKIPIDVSRETYSSIDIKLLKSEMEELIKYVLFTDIDLDIRKESQSSRRWDKRKEFPEVNNVCLFSGGADSTTGIISSYENFEGDVAGVFTSHIDQGNIVNIVNNLKKEILEKRGIRLYRLNAPRMMRLGYSQLRGLLYILFGGIYANLSNSKRIIITECGPTMYQPLFSPFDSITMTTHPYIIDKAERILQIIFNKKIELLLPFEDLTKAEVVALSAEKKTMKKTHSCVTQVYGQSDGKCYGCIIRRLAFVLAGIEDTKYTNNPFINPNRSNQDQILTLLRFCSDILLNYDDMDYYSKENIEIYKKQELFRRFALDNFSAIHKMKTEKKVDNKNVLNFYDEIVSSMGKDVLEERINEVNEKEVRKKIKWEKDR